MSDNVLKVPLNAQGALEMNLNPCIYCGQGWGNYSTGIDGTASMISCHTDCNFLKKYVELICKKSGIKPSGEPLNS